VLLSEIVEQGSIEQLETVLWQNSPFAEADLAYALRTAVKKDDVRMARLLLKHGADPDYDYEDSSRLIRVAIELERLEMIRLLVEYGADVNQRDEGGWTPLQHAIELEGDGASQVNEPAKCTVSKLILHLGGDPRLKNGEGETAMDLARFYDHEEAIELANDTPYGLGVYVFTEDKARAQDVARQLEAGMVSINNTHYYEPCSPFGGYKASGGGRNHGQYGRTGRRRRRPRSQYPCRSRRPNRCEVSWGQYTKQHFTRKSPRLHSGAAG